MADFFGTQYTQAQITAPGSNVHPSVMNGRVRHLFDFFDFAAQTVAVGESFFIGAGRIEKGSRILSIKIKIAGDCGDPVLTFSIGGVTVGVAAALSAAGLIVITLGENVAATTSADFLLATVSVADADLSNATFSVQFVSD